MTRPCARCATPLVKPPNLSRSAFSRRKYCSDPCFRAVQAAAQVPCARCGTVFKVMKKGHRFCSLTCAMRDRPCARYRTRGDKLEHRAVMEEVLGRELRPFETVHHKNGRKLDNSPGNLELWVKPQPAGQRVDDLIDWMLENYRGEVEARLVRMTGHG